MTETAEPKENSKQKEKKMQQRIYIRETARVHSDT